MLDGDDDLRDYLRRRAKKWIVEDSGRPASRPLASRLLPFALIVAGLAIVIWARAHAARHVNSDPAKK